MSLPVVLRQEARAEFDDAFDWYEKQHAGIGVAWAAEVQNVFDRISARPKLYPQIFQDVRRAVMLRFPYSVFYRIEPQRIVVLAVFHSKRDPAIWRSRTT
jgi:plasmid stabilization system protein ParE